MSGPTDQANPPPIPHRVILASAGTGKTYALTTRFLELAARGEPPERLLASTFTRKAAAEIRQRIIATLARASLDDREASLFGERLRVRMDRAGAWTLLEKVLRTAHRSGVSTLDAFFGGIARCAGWDLGIGAAWRIIDDLEDDDVRARALDGALESGGEGEAGLAELVQLVTRLGGQEAGRSVHRAMLDAVGEAHAAFLATGGAGEPWRRLPAEAGPPAGKEDIRAAVARAIDALARADLPTKADGTRDTRFVNAVEPCREMIASGDWEGLLSKGLGAGMLLDPPSYYKKPMTPGLIAALEPVIELGRNEVLRAFAHRNRAMHELLTRFDAAYRAELRARRALAFDDVTRILAEADAGGRLADIYFRLDARFDHLLLDEFQDTSIEQYRLLEPLIDELAGDPSGRRTVFVVGDVKQSLYAWRQAEPELLRTIGDRWPIFETEMREKSYRSSPVVLEAVNRVFGSIGGGEAGGNPAIAHGSVARTWADWFRPHKAEHTTRPGRVRLRVAQSADMDDPSGPAFAAAERLAEIRSRSPGASCAVLVRTKKHLPAVTRALRSRGLRVSREGGAPLTDCPAVTAVLSALWAADHPGDTAAALHAAASPIGAVLGSPNPVDRDATGSAIDRVRERLGRLGLSGTIAWIRAACLDSLDARAADRLARLERLADRMDSDPAMTPGRFVEAARRHREDAPDAGAVRVMTIHASKGLEFDAVALCDLDWKLGLSQRSVLVDRPSPTRPVRAVTVLPNELMRSLSPSLKETHERCDARETSESLCVLYVAMTRAAHELEMIIPPRKDGSAKPIAADVVRFGLADADEPIDAAAELFASGDPGWHASLRSDGGEAGVERPPAEAVEVRLARRDRAPTHRLVRTSPSGRDHGAGAGAMFDDSNRAALARGEALHAMFEAVGWLDEAPDDGLPARNDLERIADRFGGDAALVETFLEWLERAEVRSELTREPFEQRGHTLRLERELPFAVRTIGGDGRGAVLAGRFDRVVVRERDGAATDAWVIDFKTDAIGPERVEEAAAGYGPQMRGYRAAACARFGLEPERVRTRLVFAACGRVVEIG